jgi:hypothetical protein
MNTGQGGQAVGQHRLIAHFILGRHRDKELVRAEDGERAYFVLLISPEDERDALVEGLFLLAVEAMAPL